MFEDFELATIAVHEQVSLRVRTAGSGAPVVLLHGHPRTHTTWYQVAPLLRDAGFTVVCPDLRGYGQSTGPAPDANHTAYSDRAMASDVVRLMQALGHDRFAVVGHDRGAYVAYRTALDHPDQVTALAVLDGVPIVEALERADARFAELWWHWFFFTSPHAERVINADPMAWYQPDRAAMGEENYQDLCAAIARPSTVRAMLEDYRSGLHVDRRADEADRAAGKRISCPVLVAWSRDDDLESLYGDPTQIWSRWCTSPVRGAVIHSGHHMAEEAPEQLAGVLATFLAP
ncbi:alpha/beta fold hydrolase [Nostocoides sp. HKS02]|nr:alpha/beta fold hydrolase [Tetrasphaera sp. HKS02]